MEEDKNSVGRPPKFKSPEELQEKIDAYFLRCDEKELPYTVCGLALALDCDRKTLINYDKKEEYFHTIKKAKLKIEEYAEMRLYSNNVAGVIFNLKNNFNWNEDQNLNIGGQKENPVEHVIRWEE